MFKVIADLERLDEMDSLYAICQEKKGTIMQEIRLYEMNEHGYKGKIAILENVIVEKDITIVSQAGEIRKKNTRNKVTTIVAIILISEIILKKIGLTVIK